jgi:hypothetical protein
MARDAGNARQSSGWFCPPVPTAARIRAMPMLAWRTRDDDLVHPARHDRLPGGRKLAGDSERPPTNGPVGRSWARAGRLGRIWRRDAPAHDRVLGTHRRTQPGPASPSAVVDWCGARRRPRAAERGARRPWWTSAAHLQDQPEHLPEDQIQQPQRHIGIMPNPRLLLVSDPARVLAPHKPRRSGTAWGT